MLTREHERAFWQGSHTAEGAGAGCCPVRKTQRRASELVFPSSRYIYTLQIILSVNSQE